MAFTNYVLAEYIWIGGKGELRSKTKVLHGKQSISIEELPSWNYDGSSTEQAPGEDSEVIIVPRKVYPDPFRRGGENVLVVCDTYKPSGEPLTTNSRAVAEAIFSSKMDEEPWFGIEQEYTLFKDGRPLGFPKCKARTFKFNPLNTFGYPGPQGPYYCSAGASVAFGRDIVEEHLEACLYAGLTISGINAEVMPGQWEVQVGPCVGIDSGDELIATRYILNRVAEKHGVFVSYDAKPMLGDWNGAGCHTNFSTKAMRDGDNALDKVIYPAIDALGKRHANHLAVYGSGNDNRLTGAHETASYNTFSYGVANRGASIRIPNSTALSRKGYIEDRRPAANMDPYVVTSIIFDSAILGSQFLNRFDDIRTEGVDVKELNMLGDGTAEQNSRPVATLVKAEKNAKNAKKGRGRKSRKSRKSKKKKRGSSVTGCVNQ